jgi:integrase
MSAGCRPLEPIELEELKRYFDNMPEDRDKDSQALRNKTLILFSCYTGFRIAEILSLDVQDVWQNGGVNPTVYLKKRNTKGKIAGRTGVLNQYCQELLQTYIREYHLDATPTRPLWPSKKGGRLLPRQASNVFQNCFKACGFVGKLGTHSGRKTFAKNCYAALDRNIVDLQQAMGHKSLSSTQSYIAFDNNKVQNALANLRF